MHILRGFSIGNLLTKGGKFRALTAFQDFAFEMEIRIGRISGSVFAGPFRDEFINIADFE